MSSPRQQRAIRNRRIVSPSQPAITPLASLVIAIVGVHRLTCNVLTDTVPPTGTPVQTPVFVTSLPSILRVSTGTYCTACATDAAGTLLFVDFAGGNIEPGESFIIGPYDPGVRTATGGYLAPARLTVAIDPPPSRSYLATCVTGLSTLTLSWAPREARECVQALDAWRITPGDISPLSGAYVGSDLQITFASPPSDGDSLAYIASPIIAGATGLFQPAADVTPITFI